MARLAMGIGTLVLAMGCTENGLNEVTQSELTAAGQLEAEPGALRFGEHPAGETLTETFVIRSIGTAPVNLREAYIDTPGAPFTMTWTHNGAVLEPDDTVGVTVTYSPSTLDDEASVIVLSDAVDEELHIPLSGAVLSAALNVAPSPAEFISAEGEPVSQTLTLTSVGSTDLILDEQLLLGDDFTLLDSPIPTTLAPGDAATMTVLYTPSGDADQAEGELWLGGNAVANPTKVSLLGSIQPPCLGLGEAWTTGVLDIFSATGSSITLSNHSDDRDICIDRWYIYLGVETQDAGAGDPYYDPGAEFPLGSLVISPGEIVRFDYAQPEYPAWWCVEETQVTNTSYNFIFIGAEVPEPMLDRMFDGDQEAIWPGRPTTPSSPSAETPTMRTSPQRAPAPPSRWSPSTWAPGTATRSSRRPSPPASPPRRSPMSPSTSSSTRTARRPTASG